MARSLFATIVVPVVLWLLASVACVGQATTTIEENSEMIEITTPYYWVRFQRNQPPSFTLVLLRTKNDIYRVELANILEATAMNATYMKGTPLSQTLLGLVEWNTSATTRGPTGGDDADVLFDIVGSGFNGIRKYRFDSLVFHVRLILHDNALDLETVPTPLSAIRISIEAVNYTWAFPAVDAYLAFPFRFYLNEKEFLSPTVDAEADEADFGNLYFSLSAESTTTTMGEALVAKLWTVPWTVASALASSIWVMYTGCTFSAETSICGINHADGITVGFTVVPKSADKGYIAIVVLTIIAAVVLVGLIARFLYRKARKRQTFYKLFSMIHINTGATHTETELVPVRERDLDD